MNDRRLLPPTYLTIGLLAIVATHFVLSGPRLVFGWWRLLGVPLALAGGVVSIAADTLFKRNETEIKPFKESRLVVSDGLFRFSRHPMYLGFIGILLGLAVLAGTLVPMLIVVLAGWFFRTRFMIPEERHMEEQFGEEYLRYRESVRRWL
jgi:protein-S-isoprenylcysteine O-methyltransferase Ste14